MTAQVLVSQEPTVIVLPQHDNEPLYPPDINYREFCPLGDTCPGFRSIRTGRGVGRLAYCHDRLCPELWTGMLSCPCADASECLGSRWDGNREICNLREIISEQG